MQPEQDCSQRLQGQQQSSSPSSASSPRGVFSSSSTAHGSVSSLTSYSSAGSRGHTFDSRHDSPNTPALARPLFATQYTQTPYSDYDSAGLDYRGMMNATQSYGNSHPHHGYMDPHHQPHMTGPSHVSSTAAPYSYPQPGPLLQPAMSSYASQPHYPYAYASHVPSQGPAPTHPHYASHQAMSLPAMSAPPSAAPVPSTQSYSQHTPDTTGQVSPPGMRPKVTATLWEDEGTLCFQVEVNGICVARREDNHMINGTKLLNVAQMTRGRRDGILKSEKVRHVVKIGPMHLKGVWIPFERALEFANKEKITEQLYPLFVHNVGALLQPNSQTAGRRSDSQSQAQYSRTTPTSQAPNLQHSHTVASSSAASHNHAQQGQASSTRPGMDRAHTFPTPPTSATSALGNVSHVGSSYDWPHAVSTVPASHAVPVEHNQRSMPTTPATTPPDNSLHSMQHYPQNPGYDMSRGVYSATQSHQSPYGTSSSVPQYNYPKNDMAPPLRTGTHDSQNGQKDEPSDTDYNNQPYPADRTYSYSSTGPITVGTMERSQPSPGLKESPQHSTLGHLNPRGSVQQGSAQWQTGYGTSHRVQGNALSYGADDGRGTTGSATNGYAAAPVAVQQHYPYANGSTTQTNKRGREPEDDEDPYSRPASQGIDGNSVAKRQKTEAVMNRPKAVPLRSCK